MEKTLERNLRTHKVCLLCRYHTIQKRVKIKDRFHWVCVNCKTVQKEE